MSTKPKSIPINPIPNEFGLKGIGIGRLSVENIQEFSLKGIDQSHRDNFHLFFLQEKGTSTIEIDFKKYKLKPSTIIYINPNQVHRTIKVENVTFCGWGIDNENLNPENLKFLNEITPAKPLLLTKETFTLFSDAISLFINISERKKEKLYHSLMKDGCNTLVTFVVSQYLNQSKSIESLSRFEVVTKAFKEIVEHNFTIVKRPNEYAQQLNISTAYLNECVKNTTGYSVSYHIQQRIILEAKRLLFHTNKSVKEIAIELGYDDYPYFSRLFTKVTGTSALKFRNKNHD